MTGMQKQQPTLKDMAALRGQRYLIVSSDSHAGMTAFVWQPLRHPFNPNPTRK